MRAFIVRPFGVKNEIDFDEVERKLIAPALARIGAEGGTTIDIVEAGNIREVMFRRLLTADLVVADVSIHNANVFYELGIRHALRDRSTFMLRCRADAFPFDLQTDRYMEYNKDDPAASLEALVKALQRTKDSFNQDSPVFTWLPDLREPDPSQFMVLRPDFGEDVKRAEDYGWAGDLSLLSYEVKGFDWEVKGWRTVGNAQFKIKALSAAKLTWEAVRNIEPNDVEANLLLGTIYERLGDLSRSTTALERARDNKDVKKEDRAEAYSLLARNAKTRWRADWEGKSAEERPSAALRSRHLQDSFENYERAFYEDLNHFYSGLNALAMIKVMIELAESLPDVWLELFDTDKEAEDALQDHNEHATRLAGAVELSLTAVFRGLEREGKKDVWTDISAADLSFLTKENPKRVAAAYRKALTGAPGFASDSVSKQLAIYRDVGVLTSNLAEVFKVVGEPPPLPDPGAAPAATPARKRVLVFAGHMIDAPDRKNPRFPADKEQIAREKIKEKIVNEMNDGAGVLCGYAGAASGGDLLFQEVCAELGIPTRLYLAIPPAKYINSSVIKAGAGWVDRFWNVYNKHKASNQLRVLSEMEDAKSDEDYLPAWLRSKENYGIWQRNNLWMLFNAVAEACDEKTSDPNLTLIALWDGEGGDGPGGTKDLVEKVQNLGARNRIINTKELFGL